MSQASSVLSGLVVYCTLTVLFHSKLVTMWGWIHRCNTCFSASLHRYCNTHMDLFEQVWWYPWLLVCLIRLARTLLCSALLCLAQEKKGKGKNWVRRSRKKSTLTTLVTLWCGRVQAIMRDTNWKLKFFTFTYLCGKNWWKQLVKTLKDRRSICGVLNLTDSNTVIPQCWCVLTFQYL